MDCPDNWDAAADCAECLPGWTDKGDDCDTCVRYVDESSTGDGLTWATAFNTVQGGLNSASVAVETPGEPDSCEVWVKAGTYQPTELTGYNQSVFLKDDVQLYGGFADDAETWADRDWETNVTTITASGVCHVVTGADAALLDGFTISGGGDPNCPTTAQASGAGLHNDDVQIDIANCIFTGNGAIGTVDTSSYGGAIYSNDSQVQVTDCVFDLNSAFDSGGAVYSNGLTNITLTGCTFTNNISSGMGGGQGGAVTQNGTGDTQLVACTFEGNDAYNYGGAIALEAGTVGISETTFTANTAGEGGAVYVFSNGLATVERSYFVNNSCDGGGDSLCYGGAISFHGATLTVVNTVFDSNHSGTTHGQGGAIYAPVGDIDIGFSGSAVYHTSSIAIEVMNCILWGNTGPGTAVYTEGAVNPGYNYNITQDDPVFPADQNLGDDPLFVGSDPYDLHLQEDSPAIDSALSTGAPPVDVEGNTRPYAEGYDRGAYEWQG
jgi:predicted outer membrane repeat protein